MGIEPQFNANEVVRRKMEAFKVRFDKAVVFVLNELGMELVAHARLMHNYTDRTGNLTNSMGYVVSKGTQMLLQGGELSDGEGAKAARTLCEELSSKGGTSYSLWIVAGMNYAAYVEARGYNVILPAELMAQEQFVHRMKKLMAKADAKLKEMLK